MCPPRFEKANTVIRPRCSQAFPVSSSHTAHAHRQLKIFRAEWTFHPERPLTGSNNWHQSPVYCRPCPCMSLDPPPLCTLVSFLAAHHVRKQNHDLRVLNLTRAEKGPTPPWSIFSISAAGQWTSLFGVLS